MKQWLGLLLFVFLYEEVTSAISCHYCGPEKLCPLPYDKDVTEADKRSSCEKACIKFDGDSNGKRVLVRDCAQPEHYDMMNTCKDDQEYHGAEGTLCVCNGPDCNSAHRGLYLSVAIVVASLSTLCLLGLHLGNFV